MRIGIDVGGTSTRGLAISEGDAVVAEAERRTALGSAGVLQSITDVVMVLSEATPGIPPAEIGIGVPGLVDPRCGVVRHAANLGIAHLPLGRLVADATGARVVVDNDVNAATLGAMQRVHSDGHGAPQSFAYVNIGTGLGVGLVLNGQLVHGRHGHAGELGHFPLGLTERECGCGQRGCIETSTSGSALSRFNPDRDGDEPLPDDFLSGLVALLRMTTLATDPSSIVLGGGVVSNCSGFLEQVVRALTEDDDSETFLSHLQIADRVSVARATNLGALGAALLPRMVADPLEVPVG
jgi:predicted NBD/HSP70 family sugar kinase